MTNKSSRNLLWSLLLAIKVFSSPTDWTERTLYDWDFIHSKRSSWERNLLLELKLLLIVICFYDQDRTVKQVALFQNTLFGEVVDPDHSRVSSGDDSDDED